MKLTIELKNDEAPAFYAALFRAISVDDIDVFDASVCPDQPAPDDFSDEFDVEDSTFSSEFNPEIECEYDDDVRQYRLFPDVDPGTDCIDYDDGTPLFYIQQQARIGDSSVLLSLSLLQDCRVHFVAYDVEDDCDIVDICVESVHDFLPAMRCSALYSYAKTMYETVCRYIKTERGGLS